MPSLYKIPDKKPVKSRKIALVSDRKRYFISYTSKSIYRVYFLDSRWIKTVRDLEFDEDYSYKKIGTTVEEELLFSFPKLEPFTDNTFDILVRKEKELSTASTTPSVAYLKAKNDRNSFFFALSDNNSPPPQRSTKIRHKPIKYGLVTQHIALLLVAQSEICEPLSYNKAMQSPEAHFWK